MSVFEKGGDGVAEINATPMDRKGRSEILVNSSSIPGVTDIFVFHDPC